MQITDATRPALADLDLRSELSTLRRELHRYPELGFEERATAERLRSWLVERGLEPSAPLAGTGFMVEVEGERPGPTVAYRADMDALPIQEATDVPYRSCTPGVMHACGHDGHMAIGCGVALLASRRRDEIAGTVRVFFQPCEERMPSGGPRMIADGVLDGVAAAYAVHLEPTLPVGRFGFRSGPLTAACAPFVVTVASDKSGHSARPHEAVDTVWVATQVATELYQLVGRVTDARKAAVLTLCRFQGGDALNVIPARVEFGGTLRCVDGETLAFLREKVRRVAGALGAVYGADVDVHFEPSLPAVVNTAPEVVAARTAAVDVLGAEAAVDLALPSMGGEDFAYYLERVPGAMVRVGSAGGADTRYPLHHARFDLDEAALPLAARLMTEVCIRDLTSRS
ncbi:amidohydrolase [Rubrivirga sp. S365]|uniref:Amidohydrolase n=1 Tax=Rubrivirga litoralis TaxID=3075598 RepID=A0ABU3BMM3_9BACT|nr:MULTISPECIES: amidohydrolase [unclassified Rubrivirga]MDT0630534.1 amidohydrolase [Rubrivirga sp. F394]MDT7856851.1 amidohydrolase [Rubrivirga sp. S365]